MRELAVAVALFVQVVVGSGAAALAAPIQWTIASGGNGHWYEYLPDQLNWPAAQSFAASRTLLGSQGYLATITSAEEKNFLLANNVVGGAAWIGAFQDLSAPDFSEPSGGWRWVTGEAWSFTSWGVGEPNNAPYDENFVHTSQSGTWNDLPQQGFNFTTPPAILIEYDAIPEPSTALLLGLGLVGVAARRRV